MPLFNAFAGLGLSLSSSADPETTVLYKHTLIAVECNDTGTREFDAHLLWVDVESRSSTACATLRLVESALPAYTASGG